MVHTYGLTHINLVVRDVGIRQAPASHAVPYISASVLFRPATSTRQSTKSSGPEAHCYAEANSAPASHTPMSTTRTATKSKSGMSEAAGLVACIYTKIAIFSYRSVRGSRHPGLLRLSSSLLRGATSLRHQP